LGEVDNEIVLHCGLDNYVVDVCFTLSPIWDTKHFWMAVW
jgi:hypothetical protein